MSSYTCGAWQLLFTFRNLIWITMCQVQQELNRFFIAGDFWYQISQMSVGCGESSPRENNRPMIPVESSSLCFCFSLLTSEENKIWRKIMVKYKLCPINVWYGVLQTLHCFARLLDTLLLLSGKIQVFFIISVLPHYFTITSYYFMYYTGINLNACIPKIRNQAVGTDSDSFQYQFTLRMKVYGFMLWSFHCPRWNCDQSPS